MPNDLSFSRSKKYNISDNVYEHFDFFTVGENICRSIRAIKQPLTGGTQEGEKNV
jgi:hypothetical protein